jgi:hypothetical protein
MTIREKEEKNDFGIQPGSLALPRKPDESLPRYVRDPVLVQKKLSQGGQMLEVVARDPRQLVVIQIQQLKEGEPGKHGQDVQVVAGERQLRQALE